MDEFRLPIYQEILRKQYDESEALQQHVDRRARTLIQHWVDAASSQDLAPEAHASVLHFAARVLVAGLQQNDSPEDRFTLLELIAELNMTQIVGKQDMQVWFAYRMGWEQDRTLLIGRRRIDALQLTCFNLGLYIEAAVLARRQWARLLAQAGQSAAAVVEQRVALAERLIADFGSTANRLQDLAVARLELGKLTPQTRQ